MADTGLLTVRVPTVKVTLVDPAGTVTLVGTVASGLLLASATLAPPAGAELVRVTVPCELSPPVTLVGLSVTLERLAGGGGAVMVSVVERVVPL